MIDSEGYRLNVGIILCNEQGRLFWGRRIGQRSWQFPQGGIQRDESPEQAMFRELAEEVGLRPEDVQLIGSTKGWLHYRLPKRLIRQGNKHTCIGQKQVWFLLRMLGREEAVRLDLSERPEFDHWQWVDYWYPLRAVVWFKRQVYWRALRELAPLLFSGYPSQTPSTAQEAPGKLQRLEQEPPAYRPSAPLARIDYPTTSVVSVATVIRASESVRLAAAPHPLVVPLRRVETAHHPVITRMVISTRRFGGLEPPPAAPVLEQSSLVASLEQSPTTSRLATSKPRHWVRR